jgi:hypothetical protein
MTRQLYTEVVYPKWMQEGGPTPELKKHACSGAAAVGSVTTGVVSGAVSAGMMISMLTAEAEPGLGTVVGIIIGAIIGGTASAAQHGCFG